jgi:hypothetical protein
MYRSLLLGLYTIIYILCNVASFLVTNLNLRVCKTIQIHKKRFDYDFAFDEESNISEAFIIKDSRNSEKLKEIIKSD